MDTSKMGPKIILPRKASLSLATCWLRTEKDERLVVDARPMAIKIVLRSERTVAATTTIATGGRGVRSRPSMTGVKVKTLANFNDSTWKNREKFTSTRYGQKSRSGIEDECHPRLVRPESPLGGGGQLALRRVRGSHSHIFLRRNR